MAITLYDAIQTVMPVKTGLRITHVNVSASAPPTKLCDNNPNWLELILSNVGDYGIYIHTSVDYTIPTGVLLTPNGGFLSMMWNEDFDITGYQWYGYADTLAGELTVMEVISI